jgi:phage antirepressor YoqD-like protein/prophage antirepressor-like protein
VVVKCDTLEEDKEEKMKDEKMKNEGEKMQEIVSQVFHGVFEDKPIATFTYGEDQRPCWIASDIGVILGYSGDGRRLVNNISKEWANEFKEGKHYTVLKGKKLKSFKEFIGLNTNSVFGKRTSQIMLLFEPGIYHVCQKTDKPVGVDLRDFLTDKVLPKLARGQDIIVNEKDIERDDVYVIPKSNLSLEAVDIIRDQVKLRMLAEKERDGAIVLAREQTKRIIKVEEKMHEMQDEAAHGRAMMARKGGISIGEFADFVKVGGVRISQNRMFELLRGFGFLIDGRDKGYKRRRHNRPKAECIDRGWFEIEAKVGSDGYVRDGITLIYTLGEKEVVNMMIKYPLFKGEVIEYIERIGGRRIVRRYTGIGSGEQTTLPF